MKNRLKVLRAERDWSQTDLAEALGVSRQTIHAIEAEKYDPSLPLAFKIAAVFGQPIEAIFTPEDEKGETDEGTKEETKPGGSGDRLRRRDRRGDRRSDR
jgi:putative transcriptional regulator